MAKIHSDGYADPDDVFADTRMTFGEHIEDLRRHLWLALIGFAVAVVGSFFIAKPVLAFISAPVERQLRGYWDEFYQRRVQELQETMSASTAQPQSSMALPWRMNKSDFAKMLDAELARRGVKLPQASPPARLNIVPAFQMLLEKIGVGPVAVLDESEFSQWAEVRMQFANPMQLALEMDKFLKEVRPPTLSTLSVQEGLVVYFKVSILSGFVLGSPWVFYQIWAFIAAGLYPHEKRYFHLFLPFSLGLFLLGVGVCEFIVMDKAIEALLWFNQWLNLAPDLRLNEWLGFAIFMPLVFGLSFQTPLVMLFLQRVGIFTVDSFRGKRKIAWFVLAVFAAVITPSIDPVSMMFLWVPMGLLFELGIWLCAFLPGRPLLDFEVSEEEEKVEV